MWLCGRITRFEIQRLGCRSPSATYAPCGLDKAYDFPQCLFLDFWQGMLISWYKVKWDGCTLGMLDRVSWWKLWFLWFGCLFTCSFATLWPLCNTQFLRLSSDPYQRMLWASLLKYHTPIIPAIWEAGARGQQMLCQPGQLSETLYQNPVLGTWLW